MRHSTALVRRHAGIGPAEHVTAGHVAAAILANLRGATVVPRDRDEAAAEFGCVSLRVVLSGAACAKRHALATTRKGKGLGTGVVVYGDCERCPMGAARAARIGVGR